MNHHNLSTSLEKTPLNLTIHPISHASMVLLWDDTSIFIDPVGDTLLYRELPSPHIILVTDIHGDHFNEETLNALAKENTTIIAPLAVIEKLSEGFNKKINRLDNDEKLAEGPFKITAIPMYNLREEALRFHEKGRGNGYIIESGGNRIYISGDTEDIPEMRALQDIDIAFVCMNLPYTMTVESAASAVAAFKPKTVIPYHYRGAEGFSDVDVFEDLITKNAPEVEVLRIDFYPDK